MQNKPERPSVGGKVPTANLLDEKHETDGELLNTQTATKPAQEISGMDLI
jgi:hypothetical protein